MRRVGSFRGAKVLVRCSTGTPRSPRVSVFPRRRFYPGSFQISNLRPLLSCIPASISCNVALGEPNLFCAPRPARWLTPLSARNAATGRLFGTSSSLLCPPCPACRADLRPRNVYRRPFSPHLWAQTINWLAARQGLSNPKPYVPKPCGHHGDQVRSCPASPGPAISMEALNQESQRLSFGELWRLRPETNTATGPRVLSRAAFVFGS